MPTNGMVDTMENKGSLSPRSFQSTGKITMGQK